jgi:cytoskeletal protein RodZ
VGGNRPPYDVDGYSKGNANIDETERFSITESPSPWYLKRWVLALWGLAVVILIAIIIYGLAILARGGGGGAPTPATTHSSNTTSSHTTSPSPTPSSTTPTTTDSSTETLEPVPPQDTATWTPQHPRHHWWRSNLPPLPPIPQF